MFPERLKSLRLEANLTQKQVAEKLNMSQPAYQSWESGKRKPGEETLNKFANFFSVSIDYLLGKTDNRKSDEINLSEFEILYRKTSKNLTEQQKKDLEEVLKEVLIDIILFLNLKLVAIIF